MEIGVAVTVLSTTVLFYTVLRLHFKCRNPIFKTGLEHLCKNKGILFFLFKKGLSAQISERNKSCSVMDTPFKENHIYKYSVI